MGLETANHAIVETLKRVETMEPGPAETTEYENTQFLESNPETTLLSQR